MSFLDAIFRGREPTNLKKGNPGGGTALQMVTVYGDSYYSWNGKLFDSDIVRACLRPKVKAAGKLEGKHIKADEKLGTVVNKEPRLKFLLKEPNPYMTGQQLQEKLITQLCLNNNAFALIIRDDNGLPIQIYPIPAGLAEAIYDDQGNLFLRFTFLNGRRVTFSYDDIIHLRQDFNESDIFGTSPAAALSQLMECVGVADQSITKAVKNSNIIKWLLKFNSSMRPEDIQKQTKSFAEDYLSYETESFGVAAVDQKVDAQQIQPHDYVPNAAIGDRITERIYSFFNTNKSIVMSDYDEDQWNAYYQAEVEPIVIQLSDVYTSKLFTRRERAFDNKIVFEAANLQYASMKTKLGLTQFLDRGIMNANEIRAIFSLPAIEGGDVYVRRLDTAPTTGVAGASPEEGNPDDQGANNQEGGVENAENRHPRADHPE